jgi:hypothetical protein
VPNVFKSIYYNTQAAAGNVYVCPSATTAIIIGAQAANKIATSTGLTINLSNTTNTSTMVNNVAIPTNAALGFVSGKLVMEAGEFMQANCTANGDVHITLSVLEIS